MSFSPRRFRPALAPALLSTLFMASCASLPPDRGFGEVRAMAARRGVQIPQATPNDRAHVIDELLDRPLTPAAATAVALLENPRMASVYARLGSASAEVLQASRLSNPVLNASIGFTSAAGAVDRFSFGLAQDFLNLLLLPARTRLAKADFARKQLEAAAAVMALTADVDRAYYDYVAARQLAELRAAIADAAETAAALAVRLHTAGNISRLDLALQQSAAAQAQLDLIDANSARASARVALNRAMGLSADRAHWEAQASLPLPPAVDENIDALQTIAARDRLDLQAARGRVAALEDQLGVTRRSRLVDSASIGVTHERDTDNSRITGPDLSLSLPLFDQGQGRTLAAQAELEQARADADALQLDISNDVQLAVEQVTAAHARVRVLHERLVPLREQVVARTQEQMNFMLVDTFDLLLARQQEFDAWRRYIEAARDYWLARIDLAHAIGGHLPAADSGGVIDTRDVVPRNDTAPTSSSDAAPAPATDIQSARDHH